MQYLMNRLVDLEDEKHSMDKNTSNINNFQ